MGTEREQPRGAVPEAPTDGLQRDRSQRRAAVFHVGAVNDPAERQADAFADRILRSMGSSGLHDSHQSAEVAMREGGPLDGATSRILRSAGAGRPLDEPVRRKIQPMVPTDLSDVRVHTGRAADEVARRIQARAFTVGTDIYFRDGEHRPGGGIDRTLAHELGHVAQGDGRVRRLVGPAQVNSNIRTAKGGGVLDLELGLSDEESALMSLVEVADAVERTTRDILDGDASYDDIEAFSDLAGASHTLGGIGIVSGGADALTGAFSGVKGVKNVAKGFTAKGSSLDRNIGAKQIESGTIGMVGGSGGVVSSVVSVAGEEIPFLDVAMGYMEAGVKGKASIEDSVAAARLKHQKTQAKREGDRRLPDSVRMARYDEFLARVEKLEGIRMPPAAATPATATASGAPAQTSASPAAATTPTTPSPGQATPGPSKPPAKSSTLGQKLRGQWYATWNFKHGETKRFAALAEAFAADTKKDARVDKADFLAWMKAKDHKDLGYGTKHRKEFEQAYKDPSTLATAYPGFDESEYTEARKLAKVASFGRRRKAETATVNAVDAAGAAIDATGTLTAAGDYGTTKAVGKAIKAGSASYKGLKNLGKRARRVHKLRTAKNAVEYGGKSNRGGLWGTKMFFAGNIAESQKHTRTAVQHARAAQGGSGPPAKKGKSKKRVKAGLGADEADAALRLLYTQRERRFKDLWTCLLSDDKKIRDRAHAIVQAIANSSLVGAIAKVRIADLEQLHQLKSSTVQADKIKLRKMKGQLSDIFDRELSGIGG